MTSSPKTRVAVLQFPGINSEYETRRALWDAGIDAEFFRWNQPAAELSAYDGYVIAGGFSYEDRGRAGLIAAMDPVMDRIRAEAAAGKPVLGICNGAQILVESGLVPGGANHELLMCLARNKRVRGGEILGVGFYNENVYVRLADPRGRTAFTLDYEGGEIERVPVAHGEGRFTTVIPELMDELEANGQIVFQYCTSEGKIDPEFPVNPNGALKNAAAICNPAGNVMAIMPHPERAVLAPMPRVFTSMRKYMEARREGRNLVEEGLEQVPAGQALSAGKISLSPLQKSMPAFESKTYTHLPNTLEFYVKLIITDNEAQTLENALRQKGFDVQLRKWTHFEVEHTPDVTQEQVVQTAMAQNDLAQKLMASGELYNSHKESATVLLDSGPLDPAHPLKKLDGALYFLVRDREDSMGASKTRKIQHHLGDAVKGVKHGWFWEVTSDSGPLDQATETALLATNIFANVHAQEMWRG